MVAAAALVVTLMTRTVSVAARRNQFHPQPSDRRRRQLRRILRLPAPVGVSRHPPSSRHSPHSHRVQRLEMVQSPSRTDWQQLTASSSYKGRRHQVVGRLHCRRGHLAQRHSWRMLLVGRQCWWPSASTAIQCSSKSGKCLGGSRTSSRTSWSARRPLCSTFLSATTCCTRCDAGRAVANR